MDDAIIKVEGLSKRYLLQHGGSHLLRDRVSGLFRSSAKKSSTKSTEDFWALKNLSFAIKPGEVVGIIGRNGAGKSTLLKILSRITEPSEGRITLRGRIASLLEVGTGFHAELTGRENIFMNGAILGMNRAEIRRKFDEIVAFAEVDQFLDTPVKRYSSGMYVRLAFAVAAHLEPEILIVDEVLAVGDAQFQRKCLGKMKNVASQSGRTVLFVSHNLSMVTNLCQRGIWLNQGKLQLDTTAEQAVAAYLQHSTPENALMFDLDSFPREPRYRGRLQITRVELNRGDNVTNREPFSARFFFKTTSAVEGVSVGMGFSSLEGTRLLSLDSDYHNQRLDLPAGAEGSVELKLPYLSLGPGPYSIDIGARSGEVSPLDYLPACALVEVHPRVGAPAGFAMIGGGVRAAAEWTWRV